MVAVEKEGPRAGLGFQPFVAAAVVLAVFGIAVLAWMARPFDDGVPLVVPEVLPAGVDPSALPASARFRCSAVLGDGASADPSGQAVEALALQDLAREPCVGARKQYRLLGILDLVLVAAALLLIAAAALRSRHRQRKPPDGARLGFPS